MMPASTNSISRGVTSPVSRSMGNWMSRKSTGPCRSAYGLLVASDTCSPHVDIDACPSLGPASSLVHCRLRPGAARHPSRMIRTRHLAPRRRRSPMGDDARAPALRCDAGVPLRTVLNARFVDQAELHGFLNRLQSLGLEVVEVRRLMDGSRDDARLTEANQ